MLIRHSKELLEKTVYAADEIHSIGVTKLCLKLKYFLSLEILYKSIHVSNISMSNISISLIEISLIFFRHITYCFPNSHQHRNFQNP